MSKKITTVTALVSKGYYPQRGWIEVSFNEVSKERDARDETAKVLYSGDALKAALQANKEWLEGFIGAQILLRVGIHRIRNTGSLTIRYGVYAKA